MLHGPILWSCRHCLWSCRNYLMYWKKIFWRRKIDIWRMPNIERKKNILKKFFFSLVDIDNPLPAGPSSLLMGCPLKNKLFCGFPAINYLIVIYIYYLTTFSSFLSGWFTDPPSPRTLPWTRWGAKAHTPPPKKIK